MLTARQNLIETITGGNPDRFVNNYEGIKLLPHPWLMTEPPAAMGAGPQKKAWGFTEIWPEGSPGPFPVHNPPEMILIQDMEEWRDYVKAPELNFDDSIWEAAQGIWDAVDGEKAMKAAMVAPGIFEMCHHMRSITELLVDCMVSTEDVQDLVKYIAEFELKLAEGICDHLHPEAIFHHDDFGSEQNSFLPPDLMAEILLEPYQEVYGYYKSRGVKYIFHHSDSYGRNIRHIMKDMGIDVWQGCMRTNNMEEMLADNEVGLAYMGNIDNKLIDFEGWSQEDVDKAVSLVLDGFELGQPYIPCLNSGAPGTVYEGSYDALCNAIDAYNAKRFGHKIEDIVAAREPMDGTNVCTDLS